MKISLSIDPKLETKKIVNFLKNVQKRTGLNKVVIGLSGGIDSATVFYLLKLAYKPENIFPIHLPYEKPILKNYRTILIKSIIDGFEAKIPNISKIRLGNIMARTRMIILFDTAKKNDALVCGTENKSEHLLGYFTRFGDAASDIEPLSHLYKTQVYQLAKYLKVPKEIIEAKPTAGLWDNQTDEGEYGFTYQEADQVLHLYFDKKTSLFLLRKMGFKNAEKIINFVKKNQFKREAPYFIP